MNAADGVTPGLPVACLMNGDGWVDGAAWIESPNCDLRPDGCSVSLIVIHAISLPPGQFGSDDISRLFTNRLQAAAHPYFQQIADLRVSAHFLVRRDGSLVQFVSCLRRAWHAGVSEWKGRERCNDFSIGIELEGCDDLPFEHAQYSRLASLIGGLCKFYPIEAVVGHSDVAPGRKTEPGPGFDWAKLQRCLSAVEFC